MAWEWSHTQEAYERARNNLGKKSVKWLAECYAEWECHDIDEAVKKHEEAIGYIENADWVHDAGLLLENITRFSHLVTLPDYPQVPEMKGWMRDAEALVNDSSRNKQPDGLSLPKCMSTDPIFDGRYEGFIKRAKEMDKDLLVEYVWNRAEAWATCDNGGYSPHMCPSGCHTVEW